MFLGIILFIVLIYALLQFPAVQTWVVGKVTADLSAKLNTRVSIKSVDFRFFNQLIVKGVLVEDRKKDTLIYATSLKANVTDWFIFKDKVALKNIEMQDGVVNMSREDSTWNYQFLLDYFASPKKNKKKSAPLTINLNEAHLTNFRFYKVDKWLGQNLSASLRKLDLLVDSADFDKGRIYINSINLEQPIYAQSNYTGRKPVIKDLTSVLGKIPIVSAFKWNNSGWILSMKELKIVDGKFYNDKYTERGILAHQFDGKHIQFRSINGTMQKLLFLNDTLSANIALSATERSGLEIKKLNTTLKFTPELMEFKNLDLQTNRSKLGNYLSMQYQSFNEDFSTFTHNVKMRANFARGSNLNTDDLAYFGPALKTWKRNFVLEGVANGTVDNFSIRTMNIKTGASLIAGNLSMRGLPNIKSTFIDFSNATLQTNYNELLSVMPNLAKIKNLAVPKLGNINYKGNFTGFTNDFVTYGTLQTNLGTVVADINMKLPVGGTPVYKGKLATSGFQLGTFLKNTQFGTIAFNGQIIGNGFALEALNSSFTGNVKRFDYNNYAFQNINIDGKFTKKIFTGKLTIDDPNLQISSFDGSLNLSKKEPAFQLSATIEKADLFKLKLSKKPLVLSGLANLNFTGNNIDNFLGTARIYNASLKTDTASLSFDSLYLNSQIVNGKKELSLETNELSAQITGLFNIGQLPDAFKFFLARYYPTYIKAPRKNITNQDFSFTIKTKNAEPYISLLIPKLSGFNYATLSGSLKLDESDFQLNANVPQFGYDGKVFTNTIFQGVGNRDTLFSAIAVEDLKINDSFRLPNTKIKLATHNDVSIVNITTSANKTLDEAELNASIQSFSDGVKIHFFPSSFVINSKRWQLEKDGEITIRKNFIDANEVKFVQGKQQIIISTALDEENSNTYLVAQLKDIIIEDFTPFFLATPSLKGILNGEISAADPFKKPIINFKGGADSLRVNNEYVGRLNLDANANTSTGLVQFNTDAAETDYNFAVKGTYNYMDTSANMMAINFDSERFNLKLLQPFLSGVFSEMSGIAKSNIEIFGSKKEKFITGSTTINNGSVVVGYTKCHYLFDNETISFGKDVIDLGKMTIKDTLNNTGTVQGRMYHRFFKNFLFEGIRLETQKMLVLNTTKKDNQPFYGNVIGRALMTMSGPVTNLQMNIEGEPSSTDSSHVYLPIGAGKESNIVDYIDFIQFGSQMDVDVRRSQTANLYLNMILTANPACKIDVILDEETGDVLKGQGYGRLNIQVGTREPLRMTGRYDITKGEYTFNFQTFLKKPFTLNTGSITWNGDPLNAIIDLDAEYLAKNVDVSSLGSLSGAGTGNSVRQKSDITILARLTGSLGKPVIVFEFLLPQNSELRRDYVVVNRLADFKNDENLMLNQVASLLLFNSFISNEQSFLSQQNTIALATNTIGSALSGWLTGLLNKELERATKGIVSTYVDINPTLDLRSSVNQLQANIRGGLKILLTNRLIFYAGANLDYNNQLSILNRRSSFTPDLTLEWLINKDGSLRVVGFSRTSIDITTGQRNRSGVQLSYRKDVNKLGDLFKSKQTLREEELLQFPNSGIRIVSDTL